MTVYVSLIEPHYTEALSQHIGTTNHPQSGINTKLVMLSTAAEPWVCV